MKINKFNIVVILIALFVLTYVGTLFVLDRIFLPTERKKVEIVKEAEENPSYNYLKSITVYITGSIPSKVLEDNSIRLGQSWLGTGSIVKIDENYTYILTNAHVAGYRKNGVVLFVDNGLEKVEVELVAFHRNPDTIDLAVIKVKGKLKGKQSVKGFSVAYPQDKLYLVGHHLGRKYIYGEGVFAGYESIYDIVQIPALYGNSGSAVCNKEGELIGVIFAINRVGWMDVDCAHGVAINGLSVQLFLEKLGLL